MADFFQNGVITTLHKLTDYPTEQLEEEIDLKFQELIR